MKNITRGFIAGALLLLTLLIPSASVSAFDVPPGVRCIEQYAVDLERETFLGYREVDCNAQQSQTWFDNYNALASTPFTLAPNECMYFTTARMLKKYDDCAKADADIQRTAAKLATEPNAPEIERPNENAPPGGINTNTEGENGDGFIETECTEGNDYSSCGIIQTVYKMINFFSVGVGVIIVLSVILGGVQYITAGNNPQVVSKAKGRVYNAILALVMYLVLFSFIQWLVPGGLFN